MSYLFPIFAECKDWTLDPYWQEVFVQCALGKFPKGIRMGKDGSLVLYTGKTREIISVDGDSLTIFKTMIAIFKEKLGMASERDVKKQREDLIELKQKIKEGYEGSWKQIRPKNIQNNLILNYVIRRREEHNLSQETAKRLYSMIKLGRIFKSITSDDINYCDGEIQSINGLTFSNGDFSLDVLDSKESVSEKTQIEQNRQSQYAERYLKDYKASTIVL